MIKQLTLFNFVELQNNAFFDNDTWSFKKKKYIRFTYKNHKFFRPFYLGKTYKQNTQQLKLTHNQKKRALIGLFLCPANTSQIITNSTELLTKQDEYI